MSQIARLHKMKRRCDKWISKYNCVMFRHGEFYAISVRNATLVAARHDLDDAVVELVVNVVLHEGIDA